MKKFESADVSEMTDWYKTASVKEQAQFREWLMSILKNEGLGKFSEVDEKYFSYIDQLLESGTPTRDLIYQFPAYVGHVNLARFLLYL